MASQATVYSGAIADTAWTTVTAQVKLTGKPYENTDTIWSNPIVIPANSVRYIYVGVGNELTIVGANGTAAEYGTASSANAGVMD